jgi:eukaryotic-like serine/threonine-protein kinase
MRLPIITESDCDVKRKTEDFTRIHIPKQTLSIQTDHSIKRKKIKYCNFFQESLESQSQHVRLIVYVKCGILVRHEPGPCTHPCSGMRLHGRKGASVQESSQRQRNMADTEWLIRSESEEDSTSSSQAGVVSQPAVGNKSPSPSQSQSRSRQQTLDVGDILDGRYRIVNKLGSGGTSSVYLAEHLSLGNLWAVKAIPVGNDDREAHLKEAELMKQLSHPMLPRIVDIVTQGGMLCIIMDYVRGSNLADRLHETGPVAEPEVKGWLLQLCDVLSYLHGQPDPLVYRDLKPANLIADSHGHLKLVDFGTLRRYRGGETADTSYIGTQGYAAPEQYGLGQSDPRTDIYNLGMTAFHLLTGEHPVSVPHGEIECQLLEHQVTGRLTAVIRKCVQLSPANRFQSAQSLRDTVLALEQNPGEGMAEPAPSESTPKGLQKKKQPGFSLMRTGIRQHRAAAAGRRNNPPVPVPAQARIAVMGACPGAGTTFASIVLASYMAGRRRQVSLVEMNASGDLHGFREQLSRLGHTVEPEKGLSDGHSFRFGSIVYHPGCRKLTDLRGCRADVMILDLGSTRSENSRDEFLRADWRFVCCPQADWKFGHVLSFHEAMDPESENNAFIYLLQQGNRQNLDAYKPFFGHRRIVSFPHVTNPFDPNPSENRLLERMFRTVGMEG